jgi:hypothetical protein
MKWFLKEVFTDAAGRVEVKMILGLLLFLVAVGYLVVVGAAGLGVFGALMGSALSLLGLTAYGDAAIDKAKGG